jgi:hypothetical protein
MKVKGGPRDMEGENGDEGIRKGNKRDEYGQ